MWVKQAQSEVSGIVEAGLPGLNVKRRSSLTMQSRLKRAWRRSKYLWLLFLPCLLYYAIFKYAPMFGLVITFKNYNVFKGILSS